MPRKKENRGGARANAGRKKLPKGETKLPITVYIPGKVIEFLGKSKDKKANKKATEKIFTDYALAQYESSFLK